MTVQRQVRHVGGTLVAIAATLQRPSGTVVDTTDLTVRFLMVSVQGTTKVAETSDNVTETTPADGEVQYDFQAVDVDTPGTYYGYFTTDNGSGDKDTFPAETGDLEIIIKPNV